MTTDILSQKHYSLMAEYLDPDLPESEHITELLAHADKEWQLAGWMAEAAYSAAKGNRERAFILNDVLTAVQSAVSRLTTRWGMEDSGHNPLPVSPEYNEFLRRAVVPEFAPQGGPDLRH